MINQRDIILLSKSFIIYIPNQKYNKSTPEQLINSTGTPLCPDTAQSSKELPMCMGKVALKKPNKKFLHDTGDRVDWHSRYVFPVAYVLFMVIYWYGLVDNMHSYQITCESVYYYLFYKRRVIVDDKKGDKE